MKNLLKVPVLYLICSASRNINRALFDLHEMDVVGELRHFFHSLPVNVTICGMDSLANLTEVQIFESKELKHRTSNSMLSIGLANDPVYDFLNVQNGMKEFPDLVEKPEGQFLISRAQKALKKCFETLGHVHDGDEQIPAIVAHPLLIQAILWCMQEDDHSEIVRFLEAGEVVKIDFTHDMPHIECIRMHAAIEN